MSSYIKTQDSLSETLHPTFSFLSHLTYCFASLHRYEVTVSVHPLPALAKEVTQTVAVHLTAPRKVLTWHAMEIMFKTFSGMVL